jgi:hypothetical protein
MSAPVTPPMRPEAELHLKAIREAFLKDFDTKYRKGYWEHGQTLLYQQPCWSEIISEILDMVAYGYTLRVQLAAVADLALDGAADESVAASLARENCAKILSILQGVPKVHPGIK